MKLSSREKTILNLTLFVIALGGLSVGLDYYYKAKKKMIKSIESKTMDLSTLIEGLSTEDSVETINSKAEALDRKLLNLKEKVIEVPKSRDPSLLVRENLAHTAAGTEMSLNNISSRKSKNIPDTEYIELRSFISFESNLEDLLKFFMTHENKPFYLEVESLTVTARNNRRIRRNLRGKKNVKQKERPPLSGNAVFRTLYLPNENGNPDNYTESNNKSDTPLPKNMPSEDDENLDVEDEEAMDEELSVENEDDNVEEMDEKKEFKSVMPLKGNPPIKNQPIKNPLGVIGPGNEDLEEKKPFSVRDRNPPKREPTLTPKAKPLSGTATPVKKRF